MTKTNEIEKFTNKINKCRQKNGRTNENDSPGMRYMKL